MSLLDVRDLHMHYATQGDPVRAVDGISFQLEKGQALGIVGESGSGKTSLSLALMRLLPSNATGYRGQVVLEGEDIVALRDEEFRRLVRWRKMSMVFQGAMNSLNPVLKVGHQVAEPFLEENKGQKGKKNLRKEAKERVLELFDLVRLPREAVDRYPHELSGGMKQRVMIAMSLVLDPSLVILDEPTSALDVSIQAQMMNLLKDLKRDLGISFIFITHDIALASDICDRIAVMYAGEIVEIGNAEDMLLRPQHPYTQKLLNSIPRLESNEAPQFIPGAPPDLTDPPTGCRFHPRCPFAFERCDRESPPVFTIQMGTNEEGLMTRCWLLDKEKR
ncbi:MAG: ABC transporter ATP-binding protein [Chloroflexi bacterium]|nr:ABC transporter ATP-binding protein [Chloroflexota bacterium]